MALSGQFAMAINLEDEKSLRVYKSTSDIFVYERLPEVLPANLTLTSIAVGVVKTTNM